MRRIGTRCTSSAHTILKLKENPFSHNREHRIMASVERSDLVECAICNPLLLQGANRLTYIGSIVNQRQTDTCFVNSYHQVGKARAHYAKCLPCISNAGDVIVTVSSTCRIHTVFIGE